jgi:hypothetical protein
MTRTTLPAQSLPEAADPSFQPSGIVMSLIVAFLTPMFLAVSGGDFNYARIAAIETVNAYRIQNHADLIAIAQIIAFGLAALGSLGQSMADDLPLAMVLRLRANATALSRSAERNRRALTPSHVTEATPYHAATTVGAETHFPAEYHDLDDAERMASMAPDGELAADARTASNSGQHTDAQAPFAVPEAFAMAAPPATVVAEKAAEKRHQTMWAIAMVSEAQEITASIPGLPPAERRAASIRAAALSSGANELVTGVSPPPPTARDRGTQGHPDGA